jgi:hypothetical protein
MGGDTPGKTKRHDAPAATAAQPAQVEPTPGKKTQVEANESGWAGNLARSWEASYHETTRILDEWVADEPNEAKTLAATTIQSMMDLGAGLVEVLKLGEGSAEGGWGVGEDLMRLVTVIPVLGRLKSIGSAIRGMTYRPSGNLGALIEQKGIVSELRRMFWDNVGKWARVRYWKAGGGAGDRALHHWMLPNRWMRVPNGLRQAGFNLMEILGRLNSWMGAGPWRELKELVFRVGVILMLVAEEWAVVASTTEFVDEHREKH